MKSLLKIILVFCMLAIAGVSHAQSERFGDYVVYYSVVNSTFVKAEIASQYGITRGDRNAFINISVQEAIAGESNKPVSAAVSGVKQNMLQQQDEIEFTEIREGTAIYYIGEFEFSNAEPVQFSLDIQPAGEDNVFTLEWNTRVYINN